MPDLRALCFLELEVPLGLGGLFKGVSHSKGTLFWGPCNPTSWGTILGSPIFGNLLLGSCPDGLAPKRGESPVRE